MRRRILGPAVAATALFVLLMTLGVWQIERRAWKAGVLAAIDRAEQAPPVPLRAHTVPPRFARVQATGVWLAPPVALYGAEVRDGRLGAQLLELLRTAEGETVLVELGWVPTEAPRAAVTGAASVTGYVRPADYPGLFSAPDDVAGRRFFTLDPARIGAALGAPDAAPFTLVALPPGVAGGPAPAEALPRPPNNHLQYALTWFALAAVLVAMFAAWARGERKVHE